ncbi:MAG: hypothetical protein Q4G13_01670 [Moraxella sp.]|nr:hypothetical protein [Moraxella sp.]
MSGTAILFEDDNIKVCFEQGETEYLLVSFGFMNFIAKNSLDYCGKPPIVNNNISSISITAKHNHWYPYQYLEPASKIIFNKLKEYSKVINYGVSMGGYAALKYSKLFNADKVIAIEPQWSINPRDIDDTRYIDFFKKNKIFLERMSIRENDISGQCYLIYDPFNPIDNEHAKNILEQYNRNNINIIHTYFSGHRLGTILAGSDFFGNLLSMIDCESNLLDVKKIIRKKRKSHVWHYKEVIGCILRHNHQSLLFKLVKNLRDDNEFFYNPVFSPERKRLIKHINFSSINKNQALIFLDKIPEIHNKQMIKDILNCNKTITTWIQSAFGNFLVFDMLKSQLILADGQQIAENVFIRPLSFEGDFGILGLEINGNFMPLVNDLRGG